MDDETREKLVAHLLKTYTAAQKSGESAMRTGISYSGLNKCFGMNLDDTPYELPANNVADHPDGGDELVEEIKRWVRGDAMSGVIQVEKIRRNPPGLDGVQLVLNGGREEILSGTVWCSESLSSEYPPNKRWEENGDTRRLVVVLNQGNPNKTEVSVSLTEAQVGEVKGHLGGGSVPVQ